MTTIIAYLIFAIGFWAWRYSLDINDRRRPHKPDRKRGITILKPIKGDQDPCFMSNLFSFMEQDWHVDDEIIFCFESSEDPAIPLIDELRRFYPNVPISINTSYCKHFGMNPKIKTIYHAYKFAKNDLILISDSNVCVPYNYLNLVDYEHLNEDGVLTAAIVGTDCWSFWAKVESMLMQKFYNKWLIIANTYGSSIVMGKSMAFSKEDLENCGGMEDAIDYLAEDYRIGQMISSMGARTKIMSIPVSTPLGRRSMKDVFDRYVRWGRMRKAVSIWAFLAEIFASMTFVSVLLTFTKPWWVCTILMTMWGFFECQMIQRITGRKPHWFAYLVSEWITFPIWALTLLNNKVEWRGRIFRMKRGGTCVQVPSDDYKAFHGIHAALGGD